MKKVITSFIFLFLILNSFGQKLNAVFVQDTIIVVRDKTIMQTVPIPINIMSLNPTGVVGAIPNVLNFATVALAVNAMPAGDFQFTAGALPPITAGITQVAWQVTILSGTNAADNALFISVQMTYNDGAAQAKSVIIKVINKKPVEKEDKDDVDVSLLIGSNLDFFNSVKLKDLAGEFNIFLPEIFSFKCNKKEIKIGKPTKKGKRIRQKQQKLIEYGMHEKFSLCSIKYKYVEYNLYICNVNTDSNITVK